MFDFNASAYRFIGLDFRCLGMRISERMNATKNFSAVFKARRAFHKMRPDFDKDRRRIQQIRQNERVPERTNFSLLWQYYVKGKKTFKELSEKI